MTGRDDELRELIGLSSDGTLATEQARRLGELLEDDPIGQESYLDHMMVEALLEWEFGGAGRASQASGLSSHAQAPSGPRCSWSGAVFGGGVWSRSPLARAPDSRLQTPDPSGPPPDGRRGSDAPGRSANEKQPAHAERSPGPIRPRLGGPVLVVVSLLVAGVAGMWLWGHDSAGPRPLALSDGGFESRISSGVAAPADVPWYGDEAETVEQHLGVRPVEGRRMLRFVKSSAEPAGVCEVYQLVDLRPFAEDIQGDAMVEASASFNSLRRGVDDGDYTFGITLFAFADRPAPVGALHVAESTDVTGRDRLRHEPRVADDPSEEARPWPLRWRQPLMESGRPAPDTWAWERSASAKQPADADPHSWQPLDTALPLPEGTRFLVVKLSVVRTNADPDGEFPGQLADDVALNLVSSP